MTDLPLWETDLGFLLAVVLGLLILGTVTTFLIPRVSEMDAAIPSLVNVRSRLRSWWVMVPILTVTLLVGEKAVVLLYAFLSFLTLREFVTLAPTLRADHRVLFWSFFVILPLQYLFVYAGWYLMFLIFIPVYAFIFVPLRMVISGEPRDFLARAARLQWGLLVCVYFLSYVPWLLRLRFPNAEGAAEFHPASLLFWMILVVQSSDVFQYLWGKAIGKRKLAPKVSPNKTVEGFVGGILTATLLGVLVSFVTPFGWLGAAVLAFFLCLIGAGGDLILSAIKRDLGVKDWSQTIPGHGGILDRVDSLLFATPLFFHLSGFYFGGELVYRDYTWLTRLFGG